MTPARPMLAPCLKCQHPGNDHALADYRESEQEVTRGAGVKGVHVESDRLTEERRGARGVCQVIGCLCQHYRSPASSSAPSSAPPPGGIPPDMGEDLV